MNRAEFYATMSEIPQMHSWIVTRVVDCEHPPRFKGIGI